MLENIKIDKQDLYLLEKHNWYIGKYPSTSYVQCSMNINDKRTTWKLHRLIMDAPKDVEVDHINGNGLDNRRCNLRLVTRRQNQQNRQKVKKSTATSAFKGVYWHKQRNKWRARIMLNGKSLSLGSFTCEIEAAKAYNEKAIELFGEFAWLNQF